MRFIPLLLILVVTLSCGVKPNQHQKLKDEISPTPSAQSEPTTPQAPPKPNPQKQQSISHGIMAPDPELEAPPLPKQVADTLEQPAEPILQEETVAVEAGPFYYTRYFWNQTNQLFWDGDLSKQNNVLVVGIYKTARNARRIAEVGTDLFSIYATPSELFDPSGDVSDIVDSGKRIFTKPWGIVTHKWEKTVTQWQQNDERWGNSDDENEGLLKKTWGIAKKLFGFAYDTVRNLLVELPLELAYRTPQYPLYFVYDLVKPIARPFMPLFGGAFCFLVLEPVNAVVHGGISTLAGLTGTLLFTGTAAVAEGVKYFSWDQWQPYHQEEPTLLATSSDKKVAAIVDIPEEADLHETIDELFATMKSPEDLSESLEVLIRDNPERDWIIFSYIVSKLSQTISHLQTLEDSPTASEEAKRLSTLRLVYGIALENRVAQGI